jgi:thioredoxin 1
MAASKNVVTLNDTTFDREVSASPTPVLVDFGARWCAPCRALAPIVDRLADEMAGKLKVAEVDVDDAPEVAARYGVRSVPTVIVFAGGRKVGQHVGLASREKLLRLLEPTSHATAAT